MLSTTLKVHKYYYLTHVRAYIVIKYITDTSRQGLKIIWILYFHFRFLASNDYENKHLDFLSR